MSAITLIVPPSPDKRKICRFSFQSFETKANYLIHPRELMAITARLAPEDEVYFVDGTVDRLDEEQFLAEVKATKGDCIVMSLSNVVWQSDYDYFKKVKALFPGVPIYAHGDIFLDAYFRDLILDECHGVVFYPYDVDLPSMIAWKPGAEGDLPGICTKKGISFFPRNKKVSIIHENFPRHEIFLKDGYRWPFAHRLKFATVVTCFGCPHRCSYCGSSNLPPAVRPHQSVIRELEYLEKLGIKELFIFDSTFGFYFKESIPLMEEMKKRFHFGWTCFMNSNLYRPDLLDLMHAAGCHTIMVGIDSASNASLATYNRNIVENKVEAMFAHAQRLGMSVCCDFILGLEDETREDLERTVQRALTLPIDFASFNVIVPTPGTSVREGLMKKGWTSAELTKFDSLGKSGNVGNKHLSGEEIIAIRNRAVKRFYLRPSLWWRRLRKTSSFEHFWNQFGQMLEIFKKIDPRNRKKVPAPVA